MKKRRALSITFPLVTLLALLASSAGAQTRTSQQTVVPRMLERPGLRGYVEPDLKPGATITAFALSWNQHESEGMTKRLRGALGVLVGEEMVADLSESGSLEPVIRGEEAGTWSRLGYGPAYARYQAEYDEIRVIHEELAAITHPAKDIGEKAAVDLAEKYLTQLGEAGVIDPRLYEQAAMQIGYKMAGEGAVGQKVEPGRIIEYRMTFRPRLEGFQLANAGLRLGISASGQLVSLRAGGVTPAGEWNGGELTSSARDAKRQIRVGTDELMRRFHSLVPKGAEPQVAWSRVMYAMPEGSSEAVVEPMLIVSYSESRQVGEHRVVSRRKTLGFSLTDPGALPIDFDPAATKHEQTEVSRKGSEGG